VVLHSTDEKPTIIFKCVGTDAGNYTVLTFSIAPYSMFRPTNNVTLVCCSPEIGETALIGRGRKI
jgi:hypothetical protein